MRTAKLSCIVACIVAVAFSLFFFSCCPCKHLSTDTKDSVRVETHYVTIERVDTQVVELPIEVYRNVTRDTLSVVSTKYAISTARIDSGFLWHDIRNTGSVQVLTKTVTEYRDSIIYRDKVVTNTIQVDKPLTKWQRFQKHGFWLLLALFVVAVTLYVIRIFRK
ncbi:MAG: hypothetical protein PUF10_03000 [Bacteroidales bacterium]|nr:hypothetical protein [Bacteroidales bacterium]